MKKLYTMVIYEHVPVKDHTYIWSTMRELRFLDIEAAQKTLEEFNQNKAKFQLHCIKANLREEEINE